MDQFAALALAKHLGKSFGGGEQRQDGRYKPLSDGELPHALSSRRATIPADNRERRGQHPWCADRWYF